MAQCYMSQLSVLGSIPAELTVPKSYKNTLLVQPSLNYFQVLYSKRQLLLTKRTRGIKLLYGTYIFNHFVHLNLTKNVICFSGIHPRMPEVRPQDKLMHQEDLRPP